MSTVDKRLILSELAKKLAELDAGIATQQLEGQALAIANSGRNTLQGVLDWLTEGDFVPQPTYMPGRIVSHFFQVIVFWGHENIRDLRLCVDGEEWIIDAEDSLDQIFRLRNATTVQFLSGEQRYESDEGEGWESVTTLFHRWLRQNPAWWPELTLPDHPNLTPVEETM